MLWVVYADFPSSPQKSLQIFYFCSSTKKTCLLWKFSNVYKNRKIDIWYAHCPVSLITNMLGILTWRGSSPVACIVEFMGGCNRMLSLEGCESSLLVALLLFQILLLFLLDFLGPFTVSDLITTNIFSPFLQPTLSEQFELSESFFLLRHSILV